MKNKKQNLSIPLLAQFRNDVFNLAYAGHVDAVQFHRLASQYKQAGFEYGAAHVNRKLAEFQAVANE